jgi:hypothetical protein
VILLKFRKLAVTVTAFDDDIVMIGTASDMVSFKAVCEILSAMKATGLIRTKALMSPF